MAAQPDYAEPPLSLQGEAAHWNHREDADYFSQPCALFRLMTLAQRQVLFEIGARSIAGAPREIHDSHIKNCLKADPAYGEEVATALGIALEVLSRMKCPLMIIAPAI